MIRSATAHRLHRVATGLSPCAALLLSLSSAAAQSCSGSFTAMPFGNIDVTTGAVYGATGVISVSCTGTPNTTLRVCSDLGSGTGGAVAGFATRYLINGSNRLNFNIYQDAAYTQIWGSSCCGYVPVNFDIPLSAAGTGSATKTAYASVFAGQPTKLPLTYTSSFTSTHGRIWWMDPSAGTCSSNIYGVGQTTGVGPVITATVVRACTVGATDLNFGTAGFLDTAVDAVSTLTVVCTNTVPYTIGLSVGTGAGATTAVRKMTGPTGTVDYTLYRDAARTQLWGTTIGTDTLAGTGTGLAQSLTVYGRVPAQATPDPGAFSDTINVTLTY